MKRSIFTRASLCSSLSIVVCTAILLCSSLSSVSARAEDSFHRPFVIPVRTLVGSKDSNEAPQPEPDYQVRFVQWISPEVLKVRAAYQGHPSSADIYLKIVVRNHATGNPTRHVVALIPDYMNLECFTAQIFQDEFPNFMDDIRIFQGLFFSQPFIEYEEDCLYLPVMPHSVEPMDDETSKVIYDSGSHSIHLVSTTKTESYPLSAEFDLSLSTDRPGIFAFSPTQARSTIVALPVKNSFWAVFELQPDQGARLLLGPEETSANMGFIPRTMAVSPAQNNWIAYVGPETQGGWSISVWDMGHREIQPQVIGKVGINAVAYSQHRGFDHPVVWTGPDSILFLRDDELTLSHVRLNADGTQDEIGTFSFSQGKIFEANGEFLSRHWTHEFEIFRIEAVSAIQQPFSQGLRIAAVAVLQYVHEGVTQQTALPLVMDLSWNLQGRSQ